MSVVTWTRDPQGWRHRPPETPEYVSLRGKKDSADVIGFSIILGDIMLDNEDKSNHRGPYKREAEETDDLRGVSERTWTTEAEITMRCP